MASPQLEIAMGQVLEDVTKFLDARSCVRLKRTCRALRREMTHCTDAGGHYPKTKMPHFSMGDVSLWRDERGGLLVEGAEDCYGGRITSLSPPALAELHFPALRRMEFKFPSGRTFTNRPDELRDAFVHLALGLGEASNLEELDLDFGPIMRYEAFFGKMIFEVFSRNLAGCARLRKFRVSNHLVTSQAKSYYSDGLLRAIVPAARGLDLEEVTLLLGNQPVVVPPAVRSSPTAAAYDMFAAFLSLRNAKEINVQLNLSSGPLLDTYFDAASAVLKERGRLPSPLLEKFALTCVLYKSRDGTSPPYPAVRGIAPLLDLLAGCRRLYSLVLRVPPGCWEAGGSAALGRLLDDKPAMRKLGLYFHGYECPSGHAVDVVAKYVREREYCADNLIHVSGLSLRDDVEVDLDEEDLLGGYCTKDAQRCLHRDELGFVFQARGSIVGWHIPCEPRGAF